MDQVADCSLPARKKFEKSNSGMQAGQAVKVNYLTPGKGDDLTGSSREEGK